MIFNDHFKTSISKISFIIILDLLLVLPLFSQHQTEIIKFHPTPNWVKTYPIPELEEKYKLDLVLLKDETQYNHVTKEKYNNFVYYLNTKEGVRNISSYYIDYEQDYQTIQLHQIKIHRKGKIIDLSKDFHVESSLRGEQIGEKWYDNDTRINIYLDRTEVGDLVEIAYSTIGVQPDMQGALNFLQTGVNNRLIGKDYLRILTNKNKPPLYKTLNQVHPVRKRNIGEYIEIEHVRTIEQEARFRSDPKWYYQEEAIFLTDCKSWKEIVDLNLLNYQLEKSIPKTVKEKVDDLTKGVENKEEQIKIVLDYIQREIEYLDYGLIEPKRPELVCQQGYGDCKSSTLLTLKILEYLNVEAWAVLVSMDGFDDRLVDMYSMGLFDHVITEFVFEGDTLFFDATTDFQYGNIRQKYINDFRYGLRLIEGNNALTKIKHKNENKTIFKTEIKAKKNEYDGIDYDVERTIKLYGQVANESITTYKNNEIREVWDRLLKKNYLFNWCFSNTFNDPFDDKRTNRFYYQNNMPLATLSQRVKDCEETKVKVIDGKKRINIEPELLKGWLKIPDLASDAYIPLPDFNKTEFHFKIHVKSSIVFEADTQLVETDWLRYSKETWKAVDTIYALYSAEILKPFVAASRFTEVNETLNRISERMDIFIDKEALLQKNKEEEEDRKDYSLIVIVLIITTIIWFVGYQISQKIRRKRRLKQLEEEVIYLNEKVKRLKQL